MVKQANLYICTCVNKHIYLFLNKHTIYFYVLRIILNSLPTLTISAGL